MKGAIKHRLVVRNWDLGLGRPPRGEAKPDGNRAQRRAHKALQRHGYIATADISHDGLEQMRTTDEQTKNV